MMLRNGRGFTLIEVLVALAIFGVMSMLAYAALGSTLSNADYLTERMDRLQSIRLDADGATTGSHGAWR